jgi:Na+/proline symporter
MKLIKGVDLTVVIIYLAVMSFLGIFFKRYVHTEHGYFLQAGCYLSG